MMGVRQSRLICLGNEFEDGSRTPFFRPAILERFIIYAREGILEGSIIVYFDPRLCDAS